MTRRIGGLAFAAAIFSLSAVGAAHAQLARSFVSSTGDDANACTRTAPCRTLYAAVGKTNANGEVNCLDAGPFVAIGITKGLTIDCTAFRTTITSGAGTAGFAISAPDARVVLRGLSITGGGSGVYILRAKQVTLSNLRISNTDDGAVDIANETSGRVEIFDTEIVNNSSGAIRAHPNPGATVNLTVVNVKAADSLYGVRLEPGVRASISSSALVSNDNNGLVVVADTGSSIAWVSDSTISNNGVNGIATSGAGANVRLSGSTVTGNVNGLNFGTGKIYTTQPASNAIYGNETMNTPNGSLALQ